MAASLERADSVAVVTYNLALLDHRRSDAVRARERLESLVSPADDLPAWLSGLVMAELGALSLEAGDPQAAESLLLDALSAARAPP